MLEKRCFAGNAGPRYRSGSTRQFPADQDRMMKMKLLGRGSILNIMRMWVARHRQRRDLHEFVERKPHLLRDIGLSREVALREATKWFWQR
jgi:uncharacterized protein YjiS (DUF1127 family)